MCRVAVLAAAVTQGTAAGPHLLRVLHTLERVQLLLQGRLALHSSQRAVHRAPHAPQQHMTAAGVVLMHAALHVLQCLTPAAALQAATSSSTPQLQPPPPAAARRTTLHQLLLMLTPQAQSQTAWVRAWQLLHLVCLWMR